MVVLLENDTSGFGNRAETSTISAAATTMLVAVKRGDLLMQTLDYLEEEIPFSSLESLDASNATHNTELATAIQRPSANPYLLGLSPSYVLLLASTSRQDSFQLSFHTANERNTASACSFQSSAFRRLSRSDDLINPLLPRTFSVLNMMILSSPVLSLKKSME